MRVETVPMPDSFGLFCFSHVMSGGLAARNKPTADWAHAQASELQAIQQALQLSKAKSQLQFERQRSGGYGEALASHDRSQSEHPAHDPESRYGLPWPDADAMASYRACSRLQRASDRVEDALRRSSSAG
jgi:hypothetical protein